MIIERVDQLRVYNVAFRAAMDLFELSKGWPKEEWYSLIDQVRRSSRAVCANTAEAWAKRRFEKHFVSKLSDAHAEAEETRVWIRFALECGYVAENDAAALASSYSSVCGGLINMMASPDKWCGPAHLVREDQTIYVLPANGEEQ